MSVRRAGEQRPEKPISLPIVTCNDGRGVDIWGRVWVAINRRHCKTAGQRGDPKLGEVRSYVRIYASEQCPRQDSNLRSRLRRGLLCTRLTSGNVLAGVLPGHVSGTGGKPQDMALPAVHGVSRAGVATAT
jgi:hypothetical protein